MNWKEYGRNWRYPGIRYCLEDLLETLHAFMAMESLLSVINVAVCVRVYTYVCKQYGYMHVLKYISMNGYI
jgi:hypothetical protein